MFSCKCTIFHCVGGIKASLTLTPHGIKSECSHTYLLTCSCTNVNNLSETQSCPLKLTFPCICGGALSATVARVVSMVTKSDSSRQFAFLEFKCQKCTTSSKESRCKSSGNRLVGHSHFYGWEENELSVICCYPCTPTCPC